MRFVGLRGGDRRKAYRVGDERAGGIWGVGEHGTDTVIYGWCCRLKRMGIGRAKRVLVSSLIHYLFSSLVPRDIRWGGEREREREENKKRKRREEGSEFMGSREDGVDMSGSNCTGEGTEEDGLHCRKQRDGENEVCTELWHACAGPLVFIPRVGEKVYYFPQGHIEQVEASVNQDLVSPTPTFDLPWKILCRVVNVHLMAEHNTDEVFAQLALLPEVEQEENDLQKEVLHSLNLRPKLSSFCKILTASDTSTHGGFSVLKRHADECLPALDISQRPPMQNLTVKDLHGVEWCFRHVFRGQPKRHLLTTGWSTFVSSKKLVAGDAFIFVRGENEESYIGVRRAKRHQNIVSTSVMSSQSMQIGLLAAASHAISTGTMFTVYYWPRRSPSEFILPYDRYVESIRKSYMIGMRFHMRLGREDGLEDRSAGTIVRIEDVDPERWPNSKWRHFKVQWDDCSALVRPERVSPWKVELFVASSPHTLLQSRPRRFHAFQAQPPASGEDDGSLKGSHTEVLQGQDNTASVLRLNIIPTEQDSTHKNVTSIWKHPLYPDDGNRPMVDCQEQGELENRSSHMCHEPGSPKIPSLISISSLTNSIIVDAGPAGSWIPACPYNGLSASQLSQDFHGFKRQKLPIKQPAGGMCKVFGVNLVSNLKAPMFAPDELQSSTGIIPAVTSQSAVCDSEHNSGPSKCLSGSSGFDNFTGQSHKTQAITGRTGVKVHKQGTALGRSIDPSKFDGYKQLVLELDHMFEFEGSLADHSQGWQIICMDKDQDVLMIGDYPWKEFCSLVKKIFIYRQQEVSK